MSRTSGNEGRFRLDPKDLEFGHGGGGGGHKRGQPRLDYHWVVLRHAPTGTEVTRELPERGRPYSKREARAWRRAVYPELLEELQTEVAGMLRLPGR